MQFGIEEIPFIFYIVTTRYFVSLLPEYMSARILHLLSLT